MAATETEDKSSIATPPHFVLVPFVAHGHTIPMVDLAHLLAERGMCVSIVTTPFNAASLRDVAERARSAKLAIDIMELQFPPAYDALPPCSNDVDSFIPLLQALDLLAGPMAAYLRELPRLPSCIIYDWCNPWVDGVAESVGVPRIFFHGPSCFHSLCDLNVARSGLHDESETSSSSYYVVPGMPVRVEVAKAACSSAFLTGTPAWDKFREGTMEAMRRANGAVLNTFQDLEGQFITCYEAALGIPVWALGPFCLNGNRDETATRSLAVTDWLDTMDPGTVTYVSFGTITRKLPKQLYEVGHGLEDSGRPFLWVVKEAEEQQSWLRALEARTAGRGLVVRDWAPQLAILAHPAVGGFITHCGWNSMLESLAHGVPVVTWPHLADQFLNQRLAVDVLGVGVPVSPDNAVPVRGDVARAVLELMGTGEAARERRRKAKEYGERAHKAMEKGGSSYENLTKLVRSFAQSPQPWKP